jgi:iron complex outermembrane recepter protein
VADTFGATTMYHMLRIAFLLSLFIGVLNAHIGFAQSGSISGRVTGPGLSVATVTLLKQDSSWVRSDITDENGSFRMPGIAAGKYFVMTTALGFRQASQVEEVKDSGDIAIEITMQEESKSLGEVAVTAKKPFIEMGLGKLTVNIENTTTTAASTVLDLLRRLPGITVTQDGSVVMHGKEGVLILIDDRPTYLSGEDLADYLKTISADDVSQIELISQPGAKYDAAGNNGIINIKLKRNKRQGCTGSVMGNYGLGEYFHRNESVQINYKKNKINLSMNINDMEAIGFADWEQATYFLDNAAEVKSMQHVHSTAKERFGNQSIRAGVDYDWSDKTTTGISARGNYHPNVNRTDIQTTEDDPAGNKISYNKIINSDGFIRKDITANSYLSHKFSNTNKLDINFDYMAYFKKTGQDITNTMYGPQMQPLPDPVIQNIIQRIGRDVYSFKADYTCTFNKLTFETGAKTSMVSSDIDVVFNNYLDNTWENDSTRSNHFLYRENINAAYVTVAENVGKDWELRASLRTEQTNAEGIQYADNDRFAKSYLSLFPTAYITWKKDTNNTFEMNYGRRINRPSYTDLNPFVYFTFQNLYSVGNPALRPQYTNNVEIKHSYKNVLITSLSFSRTTDVFQGFLTINDTTKISYYTTRNVASNNSIALSSIFNKDLFKWWSLNVAGTVCYADFSGLLNNVTTKVEWIGFSADLSSRFDFGKGWRGEIYSYYVSKGRWSLTSSFDPIYSLDFGCSKKINEHFFAKFFANDPFYIFRMNSHGYDYNYRTDIKHRFATQMFSLSITYNFGSGQVKESKDNSPDEAKRM